MAMHYGKQYYQLVVKTSDVVVDYLIVWVNENMKYEGNYLVANSTNIAQPSNANNQPLFVFKNNVLDETSKLVLLEDNNGNPILKIWFKIFKSQYPLCEELNGSLVITGGKSMKTENKFAVHLIMPLKVLNGLTIEKPISE